jgi:hypothetical protein
MEEADQLCNRVAIIDKGVVIALDTPRGLKRALGADSSVRVVVDGDRTELANALQSEIAEVVDATVMGDAVVLVIRGGSGVVIPTIVQTAERHGFHIKDPVRVRSNARNRLHQPDRQGPARMTTITPISDGLASRSTAASRVATFGRSCCDLTVLRKNWKEFPRTILQPCCSCSCSPTSSRRSGRGGRWRRRGAFSSVLVAGVVAIAIFFQGIRQLRSARAGFGTREIEERVLAPLPIGVVACEDRRRRCSASSPV